LFGSVFAKRLNDFKLDMMKKMNLNKMLFVALIGSLTLLTSCQNLIPFTNVERTRYNFDEAKLKKLQYYISKEVTLQRGEHSGESQELDSDGTLIVSSSASLDNIAIDAKTPGVCVGVLPGNKLKISFDPSDDNKYLVFGDPNNNGRYAIMGADWKNGKGKINYGNKVYYIMSGGAGAYLKFEMKKVKDYKKSSTKVKGRKVN